MANLEWLLVAGATFLLIFFCSWESRTASLITVQLFWTTPPLCVLTSLLLGFPGSWMTALKWLTLLTALWLFSLSWILWGPPTPQKERTHWPGLALWIRRRESFVVQVAQRLSVMVTVFLMLIVPSFLLSTTPWLCAALAVSAIILAWHGVRARSRSLALTGWSIAVLSASWWIYYQEH